MRFNEWRSLLKRVNQHLEPDDLFIFDMNTIEFLNKLNTSAPSVSQFSDNEMRIAAEPNTMAISPKPHARAKVYADLGSTDDKTLKNSGKAYQRWFENDRDLPGWVLKVLEGGVTRKLYKASMLEGLRRLGTIALRCGNMWTSAKRRLN